MVDKEMLNKEYEFFLVSGKKFKGVLKRIYNDCIILEVNSQLNLNGSVTSEVNTIYHIAMDKIEYIKISEEKIK